MYIWCSAPKLYVQLIGESYEDCYFSGHRNVVFFERIHNSCHYIQLILYQIWNISSGLIVFFKKKKRLFFPPQSNFLTWSVHPNTWTFTFNPKTFSQIWNNFIKTCFEWKCKMGKKWKCIDTVSWGGSQNEDVFDWLIVWLWVPNEYIFDWLIV